MDQCPVHEMDNIPKTNNGDLFSIFILGADPAHQILNQIKQLLEPRTHQMLIKGDTWVTPIGAGVNHLMNLLLGKWKFYQKLNCSLFVAVRPVNTDCYLCWQDCYDKG